MASVSVSDLTAALRRARINTPPILIHHSASRKEKQQVTNEAVRPSRPRRSISGCPRTQGRTPKAPWKKLVAIARAKVRLTFSTSQVKIIKKDTSLWMGGFVPPPDHLLVEGNITT